MSSVTSFLVWILATLLVPVITTSDGHDLDKFDRIQWRLCDWKSSLVKMELNC